MIADPDLLKKITLPFRYDKEIACVTGKILPKWESNPPAWALTLRNSGLLSLHNEEADLIISPYDCGVFSCHQAIKRDIFFKAGGFNPENTAGLWIGDGETGLNIKIRKLGYKFAYTGNSVIYHTIPESRMTQQYLNKRLSNQGNSDSYTDYKKHRYKSKDLYLRIFRHFFLLLAIQPLRLLLKGLTASKFWRIELGKFSYYFSRVEYDYKLIRDENWRRLVLKENWLND